MGKDLNGKEIGNGFSQRKEGRYEARAMVKGRKIYLTGTSLKVLKKEFEQQKLALQSEAIRSSVFVKKTFDEWYTEWFTVFKRPQLKGELSAKTYDRKVRNTVCKEIGDMLLRDITQMTLQTVANELAKKGYKNRSIREALGIVRECLDMAILNHYIDVNPCVSINVREDEDVMSERRVLEGWEQDLFLEEAAHGYYYEAYQILLLTGMRIGEFSVLWWSDIDYENKVIHINRSLSTGYVDGRKIEELTSPKTSNSYRENPFFGETEKLFRQWKVKQDQIKAKLGSRWRTREELGDLVFTSTMGSPVTRYVIVHDIDRVVENVRLKERSKMM